MQELKTILNLNTKSERSYDEEAEKKDLEWLCEVENRTEGDLNKYDGYDCAICKNRGYLWVCKPCTYSRGYQMVTRTCKCEKIRRSIRALNRSGLSTVVKKYRLDTYDAVEDWQKYVLNKAKAYIDGGFQKHWLYFGGQSGCGKTHICTAVAIALLKKGYEVKYMVWIDDAKALKAKANTEEYAELVEQYKTVDVLYIDDLFKTGKKEGQIKQQPTQADINLAIEILNARLIANKITVISSETLIADMLDLDEATAGRVVEKCGDDYCINVAPDKTKNYRLKGLKML